MVFKVQQKYWHKNKNKYKTFDYLYWKNRGWLEKKCNYYVPHNASFIKVRIAGIVGKIISLFFV